jgi:hypothetical protein
MRQREDLGVPTLANLLVALWRLGTEGIGIAQTQRAFRLKCRGFGWSGSDFAEEPAHQDP